MVESASAAAALLAATTEAAVSKKVTVTFELVNGTLTPVFQQNGGDGEDGAATVSGAVVQVHIKRERGCCCRCPQVHLRTL